jgi:hypothetical protein
MKMEQMYEIEYIGLEPPLDIEIVGVVPLILIENTLYRPEDAARIFLGGKRA